MKAASALILALLLGLLGWLFLRRPAELARPLARATTGASSGAREGACPRLAPVPVRPAPLPPPARVRWVAVGAAETPAWNQVQIEQDAELLRSVLGPSAGVVLLGGGPGGRDVQVSSRKRRGDAFLQSLADLLSPRGGRDSHYRRSRLPLHASAGARELRSTLAALTRVSGPPLLLYLGGHGDQGAAAKQTYVSLWGGHRLTAEELAGWLDGAARPVQLVVTTCYGGGFAEAVFRGADPAQGVAQGRCGLFATTHDLPASGCDPNPVREAQEGYALHLFSALARRDRDGKLLPASAVDLDGDGAVSLAEAHARARIDLDSVDVPTTTSERWLRQVAPGKGRRLAVPLVEERAVARALAQRTRLPEERAAVRRELTLREAAITRARERLDRAAAVEDDTAREAIGALLARWPVLDDPWHPDFAELLRCQRKAIEEHLRSSRAYAEYQDARDDAEDAEDQHWTLRRQAAPVERLGRALETIELAERLRARGGADWKRYEELVACERGVPTTSATTTSATPTTRPVPSP